MTLIAALVLVHELLVVLLNHSNREVVFTTCGILMNLCVDSQTRDLLHSHEFVDSMIEVLITADGVDWQLAGTCSKALWNYLTGLSTLVKEGNYEHRISFDLMQDLLEVLTRMIGMAAG